VVKLLDPASPGITELERPHKLIDLLEGLANSEDLVNEILDAYHTVLSNLGLDDTVVSDRNALLINLDKTALVNQLFDCFQVGVAVGHVRLNKLQHSGSGLVEPYKYRIVDLPKTQQLQDLSRFRVQIVDTADAYNKGKLWLWLNVEIASRLSLSTEPNK